VEEVAVAQDADDTYTSIRAFGRGEDMVVVVVFLAPV
jgi:hypothetical protein